MADPMMNHRQSQLAQRSRSGQSVADKWPDVALLGIGDAIISADDQTVVAQYKGRRCQGGG